VASDPGTRVLEPKRCQHPCRRDCTSPDPCVSAPAQAQDGPTTIRAHGGSARIERTTSWGCHRPHTPLCSPAKQPRIPPALGQQANRRGGWRRRHRVARAPRSLSEKPGAYCARPTAASFGDRSTDMATTMLVSRSPTRSPGATGPPGADRDCAKRRPARERDRDIALSSRASAEGARLAG